MRVIFAGTPDVAVSSLDALTSSKHEVVAVITRPDAASGRGRRLHPSSVATRAEALGIPVLRPVTLRGAEVADEIQRLAPDCCPVVAYGQLVPPDLLVVPRHGWVNVHFSLLPAWRGAAPVQHALLHGDDITGVTTFRLTEGLDTGPVFGAVTETVRPNDTAGDLLGRLAVAGAELLIRTLDGIETGELVPHDQDTSGVSLAPKVTVEDARVRWNEPALAVERRVRACTPRPGAWTEFEGRRLGVMPLEQAANAPDDVAPGALRVTKHEVWVGTGSTPVRLGDVKPEGKGVMRAADWARGIRVADDDRLT